MARDMRLDVAAIIAADTGRRLGDRPEDERRHLFLLADKVINIVAHDAATIRQAKANALREAAEALVADTYGPDFEGFGENWTDDGKQVYALAIGEAQDAIRDRADRIAAGGDQT